MKQKIQHLCLLAAVTVICLAPNAASAFSLSVGFSTGGGSNGGMGSGGGGFSLANASGYGLPSGSIMGILSNALDWLLGLFAILGIVGFVISGIFYLTAAGDEGQIDKAKEAMKYSILGIIVGLIGFVVMQAVFSLLAANNATF